QHFGFECAHQRPPTDLSTVMGGTPSSSVSAVTSSGREGFAPALGRSESQILPLSEANASFAACSSFTLRLTLVPLDPMALLLLLPTATTGMFDMIRRSMARLWPLFTGVPSGRTGTTLKPA